MNATLQRLARNASSLFASSMLDRAATLVFYALIGQWLGTEASGQLSLGLTTLYAFQVLSGLAMRVSITRHIAQRPNETNKVVAASLIVVLVMSLLSMLALNVGMRLFGYSDATLHIVTLLSLMIAPAAFGAVFEGVFHGREQMQFIAIANAPMLLIRIVATYLLLATGHGLESAAYVLIATTIGATLIAGAICFAKFLNARAVLAELNPAFAWRFGRDSIGLVGIDALIAFTTTAIFIMISRLLNESELGIYNAATQMLNLAALLRLPVVAGSFPVLVDQVRVDLPKARDTAMHLIRLLLAVMAPAAIGLSAYGAQAFELIQGEAFTPGVPALRILSLALIIAVFTGVLGQVLVAASQERLIVRSIVLYSAVNLATAAVLVPRFGATGAAIASIVAHTADMIVHLAVARRVLKTLPLMSAITPAALACCPMLLVMAGVHSGGMAPYPAMAIATLTYAVAIAVILLTTDAALRGLMHRLTSRLFARQIT